MKRFVFLGLIFLLIITYAFVKVSKENNSALNSYKKSHIYNKRVTGAPNGKTGAPGEGKCTDCHSGTAILNSDKNSLILMEEGTSTPVSIYQAGVTYDVFLTVNDSALRKGFQATARFITDNSTAGNLQAVSGSTALSSATSKQFMNHIQSSTTIAAPFAFKWTAPATNAGEVRFYVASNITNNNNSNSGDKIHLSQHNFLPQAPVASFIVESNEVCANSSVIFSNTSIGGPTNFSWNFEGANPLSSIEENPSVTYADTGTYQVVLTVSNPGGSSISDTLQLHVVSCANTKQISANQLTIFPNPTGEILTIANINLNEYYHIRLINSDGKIVFLRKISNTTEKINVEHLKKGLYTLQILGKSDNFNKQITIN